MQVDVCSEIKMREVEIMATRIPMELVAQSDELRGIRMHGSTGGGGGGGWVQFGGFRNGQPGVGPRGSIARRDMMLCIREHAIFCQPVVQFQQLLTRFVSFSASDCQEFLEVTQFGLLELALRFCVGPRAFQLQGCAE